jgi:hypothetical protein
MPGETVLDTQTQALLQEVFRREGQSFLLYVHDAFPWTTAEGGPALVRLQRLIESEREALAALGRYLVRHQVPLPFVGAYPTRYTSFNYQSLESLVPKLIDAEKRLLADLERDLASVPDAAARAELGKLADLKRRHAAELDNLLKATPQPVSV